MYTLFFYSTLFLFSPGICGRALMIPTYNEKSFQFNHPGSWLRAAPLTRLGNLNTIHTGWFKIMHYVFLGGSGGFWDSNYYIHVNDPVDKIYEISYPAGKFPLLPNDTFQRIYNILAHSKLFCTSLLTMLCSLQICVWRLACINSTVNEKKNREQSLWLNAQVFSLACKSIWEFIIIL